MNAISTGFRLTEAHILDDPAASDWLKQAIRSTRQRDPIDAHHDAEILYALLTERLAAVLAPTP
jgi:hypothetical protein